MRARAQERTGRTGFTLLELVLVMFILALILGGGLGLFAALDLGQRQAAGVVRNALRSAQNTAIARSAPARVRIDRESGALVAEAMLVIGTYHFESRALRGYGPEGVADPELFSDDGYMGAALRPAGAHGASAEIPLEGDPAFDFTLGFALECAVQWDGTGGGRVLAVGHVEPPVIALELGHEGALRARFRVLAGAGVQAKSGGQVILETDPGVIAAGRWTRVQMRYDRDTFELLVDGVVVESAGESSFVDRVDGPLVLTDRSHPFPGKIDALVISAMIADAPVFLPEHVRFSGDTPERVEFGPGGGLDRAAHADPPRIVLEYVDGTRQTITVGFYGTVE